MYRILVNRMKNLDLLFEKKTQTIKELLSFERDYVNIQSDTNSVFDYVYLGSIYYYENELLNMNFSDELKEVLFGVVCKKINSMRDLTSSIYYNTLYNTVFEAIKKNNY
jgi:hypothetical protein